MPPHSSSQLCHKMLCLHLCQSARFCGNENRPDVSSHFTKVEPRKPCRAWALLFCCSPLPRRPSGPLVLGALFLQAGVGHLVGWPVGFEFPQRWCRPFGSGNTCRLLVWACMNVVSGHTIDEQAFRLRRCCFRKYSLVGVNRHEQCRYLNSFRGKPKPRP